MNTSKLPGIAAFVVLIIIIVVAISRAHPSAPTVQPAVPDTAHVFTNVSKGFSISLPAFATSSPASADSFAVDEAYHYQELGPGKDIAGVKFTIPSNMATGTNLSSDSYLSIEEIPQTTACSAKLFLSGSAKETALTDAGRDYSVATSSDAAAGNRYEETVYAIPGTNPCIAIRYFIHYGAIENYPPGAIEQFDRASILAEFDTIRRTLVINQ